MAAPTFSRGDATFADINVTPLVDIMLVLLVIFMVTAKLIVGRSMPVDLPKAATGRDEQVVLAIGVKAGGEIAVDAQPVASEAALLALARRAKAQHKELRAVIQADKSVVHGRVVTVMDVLAQAGIAKVAFGVTQTARTPE